MASSIRTRAALVSLVLLAATAPRVARAQAAAPPSSAKAEAHTRFDEGIRLFNDGDNAGALAEFQRAYQLIPNTLVLYNIGLVYAAMGRPVEAVAALDEVLAHPGSVVGEKLARAKETRDQQSKRIVELSVVTNVPAAIDVDGVSAGQTPLGAPVKVAGGLHVIGAAATGYSSVHKEITVAGGTKQALTLSLLPLQAPAAHVTVRTHVPGAEVFVDGKASGKTPLSESLTLAPGEHAFELRREGYRTARQELRLGDGATADLELEPEEDRAAIAALGGRLAVDASEPNAVVTVDGTPHGVYAGALNVAPGEHHLVVERGGFEPKEADAFVSARKTTTVSVILDPTPETRADYERERTTRHVAGILVGAGGLLLAGGAIAFIAWNAGQVSQRMGSYDSALSNEQEKKGICNTRTQGGNAMQCNAIVNSSYDSLKSAENLTPIGYVGLGVGAAAVVTGLVLYFTAGRADRFGHPATAVSSLRLSPWTDAHGAGMGATIGF